MGDSGMTSIRASYGGTETESAFCEIQTVAHGAPDAIVRHPLDVRLVYSTLINQILDQSAHWIVGQRRNQGCIHSKAAPQAPRYVIFTPAFPGAKRARGRDAAIPGIEAQHHLAQAYEVPPRASLRLDWQWWFHQASSSRTGSSFGTIM